MREIKFRGKSLFVCDWHEGLFLRKNGQAYIEEGILLIRVKEDTIGQYTGLRDKNGVEIYEGDIVKVFGDADGYFHEKRYITGFVRFEDIDGYYGYVVDYRNIAKVGYYECLGNCEYDIEVIGTIHDNPELLEE